MTGKLCDVPVQPLSRSLPLPSSGCAGSSSGTVIVRDFCPGAQFDGRVVVVVVGTDAGETPDQQGVAEPLSAHEQSQWA